MLWKWNLNLSTALTGFQKTLEAQGYNDWLTNLSIVLHKLGILTASVTYCIILIEYINQSQVNACVV